MIDLDLLVEIRRQEIEVIKEWLKKVSEELKTVKKLENSFYGIDISSENIDIVIVKEIEENKKALGLFQVPNGKTILNPRISILETDRHNYIMTVLHEYCHFLEWKLKEEKGKSHDNYFYFLLEIVRNIAISLNWYDNSKTIELFNEYKDKVNRELNYEKGDILQNKRCYISMLNREIWSEKNVYDSEEIICLMFKSKVSKFLSKQKSILDEIEKQKLIYGRVEIYNFANELLDNLDKVDEIKEHTATTNEMGDTKSFKKVISQLDYMLEKATEKTYEQGYFKW